MNLRPLRNLLFWSLSVTKLSKGLPYSKPVMKAPQQNFFPEENSVVSNYGKCQYILFQIRNLSSLLFFLLTAIYKQICARKNYITTA